MRRLLVCVALALSIPARSGDAQSPQRPTDVFRGQVDLLTIDVSATDSRGRPVEDLKPGDFTVRVDGTPRPIASVELVTVDRAQPVAPVRPVDALVVSNVSPQNARRIVVAVDQTLITPGMLTPLLRTAGEFVNRLLPADYAAFIGFPEPGPRVDFTTDKALVHKAMQTISIGQAAKTQTSMFNISLYESVTITGVPADVNLAVYQASYTSGKWNGELKAYAATSAGVATTPTWSASGLIPTTGRTILTWSGTGGTTFPTLADAGAAVPSSAMSLRRSITAATFRNSAANAAAL